MGKYPKRARTLLLLEYFSRCTDEQNPKQLCDIRDYLFQQGIEAERKALYADIALLRDLGYDIVKTNERKAAYFLGKGPLRWPRRRYASVVSAALFVTERKSRELIRKARSFGSAIRGIPQPHGDGTHAKDTKRRDLLQCGRSSMRRRQAKRYPLYFEYMPDKTQRLKKQGQRYASRIR